MTSAKLLLRWKENDRALIGEREIILVDVGEVVDDARVNQQIQSVPADVPIKIYCRLKPGDEATIRLTLEALSRGRNEVTEWSLELISPPRGGYGSLNVKELLEVMKPSGSIRFKGCVSEGIEALSDSPAHLQVLEKLLLEDCGSSFSSIEPLKNWPQLLELEISGANNVVAPWSEPTSLEGFAQLRVVRLVSIASLQHFSGWVAPSRSDVRRPTVELGAVNLPPGRNGEFELGSHVQWMRGSSELSPAHLISFGLAISQFRQACGTTNPEFRVSKCCSPAELLSILRDNSNKDKIVCTDCELLGRWPLAAWLPDTPDTLGMAPQAELLQIELPSLIRWADQDCDLFVKRFESFATQRAIGGIHVSLFAAPDRLLAWSCVLKWSGSRVTLIVNPDVDLPRLTEDHQLHLDFACAKHRLICELLIKRGVRAQFLERVCVGGKIAPPDFELFEGMLKSIEGLNLFIKAECSDGAEWKLWGFASRNRERVKISDLLKDQLQGLDCEREDYKEALKWALPGGIAP